MTKRRKSLAAVGILGAAAILATTTPAQADTGTGSTSTTTSTSGTSGSGNNGVGGDAWRSDKDLGSLYTVNQGSLVSEVWSRGITGKGVGVALVDSGVTPVKGVDDVLYGPDLSFESQAPDLRNLDTFGHGTHMAGIITGRDPEVRPWKENDPKLFVGVAPDSTLLSLKVAASDGATDVSQVIAAIDWAVQHRNDPGLNIRVLNLSFGTASTQSYLVDPLAMAVEAAWRNGIVVVVSAGNDGNDSQTLTDPAIDPYVIAVGAADHKGTVTRTDDAVATFSSRGSIERTPDLVAPGRSLASLRDPGSYIDQANPTARVADRNGDVRFFRGSGTSQAAAYVSGVASLLLQQRPNLTPDQVKALLTSTADPISSVDRRLQGNGLLDVWGAFSAPTPIAKQVWPVATGLGSLELARGGSHVADPETGEELVGEQDIFGMTWDGRTWAQAALEGRTWADGVWNGRTWAGSSWTGRTWASVEWTGRTWAGRTWAGRTWADGYWDGRTWAGRTWADANWAGRTWAGRTWAGRTWAGLRWN